MGAPGLLLVLSAPSGAGKTTLARRFVAETPDAFFSVSATTRAARGAEREGVDYHFLSPERFEALVRQGALAEWAEVHGSRYGTLRATVDRALAEGRLAVLDIDVNGGEQIKAGWPEQTATVLVLTPTPAELERRLRGRSTDSAEAIRVRLAAARVEVMRGAAAYDYILVNDDLEKALGRLRAVAAHERARLAGSPEEGVTAVARACRRGEVDISAWLR